MKWLTRKWASLRRQPERGDALAVFMVTMAIPMMALIGLVADGGAKLAAINHAGAVAAQAARTAGQQLDTASLLQGSMPAADVLAATAAAEDVMADQGVTGTVQIDGDQITVTTTATSQTFLLSLFGIDTVEGEGSATVRLATEEAP